MSLLIIDNYDSFTYNLVHYFEELLDEEVTVMQNDEISSDSVLAFDRVVISPGPGLPGQSGLLLPVLHAVVGKRPLLGICLGLQAIVINEGGSLRRLDKVLHGMQRDAYIRQPDPVFNGIGSPFKTGHYHSWVADEKLFPSSLEVIATDAEGNIMAIRHRNYPVHGLQFHPESILTPQGKQMLFNWLSLPAQG